MPPTLEMSTLKRPCPVCESVRGEVLHRQTLVLPDELAATDAGEVVSCASCGFVFADVAAEQATVDEAYRDHSKYAASTDIVTLPDDVPPPSVARWDAVRLQSTARYLAERLPAHDLRVLDAGCATGALLGFMKAEGFTSLLGLDPSPQAVAMLERFHGIPGVAGSVLDPPEALGQFDLVVLSHVLEHILDVQGAARALASLLASDGVLYIEVPDATRYADYLVAPFHDFNNEHINHFSIDSLRRLLGAHGLEEVEVHQSVVPNSATNDYPAVFGLWRRTSSPDLPPPDRAYDLGLRTAIQRYVNGSEALLDRICGTLDARLAAGGGAYVWGAGNVAMRLMGLDPLKSRVDVRGIVDASPGKQGMHFGEHIVVPPAAVRDPDVPIVVASLHHAESIARAIREVHHLPNEIVLLG